MNILSFFILNHFIFKYLLISKQFLSNLQCMLPSVSTSSYIKFNTYSTTSYSNTYSTILQYLLCGSYSYKRNRKSRQYINEVNVAYVRTCLIYTFTELKLYIKQLHLTAVYKYIEIHFILTG